MVRTTGTRKLRILVMESSRLERALEARLPRESQVSLLHQLEVLRLVESEDSLEVSSKELVAF